MVAGLTLMVVAGIGIAINGLSAWLFVKRSKVDLNIRGAYLHMVADAAVSLGVVIAGMAMLSSVPAHHFAQVPSKEGLSPTR